MATTTSNAELLLEFGYIIDKIHSSQFHQNPFKFLLIEDFLSEAHFDAIINAEQINRPVAANTESLIQDLFDQGYEVQHFPGCTTSVKKYLSCYNSNKWPVDGDLLEGFGITLRISEYRNELLSRIVEFMNTPEFKKTLEEKFNLTEPNFTEIGIQKYLHGYEISPHPDVRRKALTFMLNINTSEESEQAPIHTHILRIKPEKRYLYDFWKYNDTVERAWIPWNWCTSNLKTNINNSIIIFAPAHDTLHGVKLRYDHLKYQRTQIYGNLWYQNTPVYEYSHYPALDLVRTHKRLPKNYLKSVAPLWMRKIVRKLKN